MRQFNLDLHPNLNQNLKKPQLKKKNETILYKIIKPKPKSILIQIKSSSQEIFFNLTPLLIMKIRPKPNYFDSMYSIFYLFIYIYIYIYIHILI
jgi:hypothetical protein